MWNDPSWRMKIKRKRKVIAEPNPSCLWIPVPLFSSFFVVSTFHFQKKTNRPFLLVLETKKKEQIQSKVSQSASSPSLWTHGLIYGEHTDRAGRGTLRPTTTIGQLDTQDSRSDGHTTTVIHRVPPTYPLYSPHVLLLRPKKLWRFRFVLEGARAFSSSSSHIIHEPTVVAASFSLYAAESFPFKYGRFYKGQDVHSKVKCIITSPRQLCCLLQQCVLDNQVFR